MQKEKQVLVSVGTGDEDLINDSVLWNSPWLPANIEVKRPRPCD